MGNQHGRWRLFLVEPDPPAAPQTARSDLGAWPSSSRAQEINHRGHAREVRYATAVETAPCAIGRKGGFEAEMIFESEAVVVKSKPVAPNSPVRIDSIFDMPEIKPIVLPGAWTTVGKGGRPLRGEQKMYDEPQK